LDLPVSWGYHLVSGAVQRFSTRPLGPLRLTLEELADRIEAASHAVMRGELAPLTTDLPVPAHRRHLVRRHQDPPPAHVEKLLSRH
jgi:hypothetical protein